MSIPSRKPIPFDLPATYQIRVLGKIDPTSSNILGGMKICPATMGEDSPVTSLEGEVRDQAALVGVLNSLYGMHLTLISINRISIC
jgi:hypothetical protein